MGIHGLMSLLAEEAPESIREQVLGPCAVRLVPTQDRPRDLTRHHCTQELANYTGRKVAIDASMTMYQFLVAVRAAHTLARATLSPPTHAWYPPPLLAGSIRRAGGHGIVEPHERGR